MLKGYGTKEQPYVLTTLKELREISKHLSSYFVLEDDITVDGEFDSIGNEFEAFTGVFDGRNHSIKGLSIQTETQYVGLFSYNKGVVKNLKIVGGNISATAYIGMIAGLNDGVIKNCHAGGILTGTSKVGGITGFNHSGSIVNCISDCQIFETVPFLDKENNGLELFVSLNADSHGDGSKGKPFKTIEEARDFVRELIVQEFSQNITVFIREGTYYIEKTFELNEKDCFKNGNQIIYTAYKNENVTLIGGKPISCWENTKKGLQRAFVGSNISCKYLCVDGKLKAPAKSHNWHFKHFDSANVYAYFSHGWFSEILKINKRPFKVETTITKSKFSGKANYLMGAVDFIKKDDDWALSRDGYIYYKNISEHKIIVPTVKDILFLNHVRNITIKGLRFSVTDRDENFTAQGGRGKEGFDGPENTHAAVSLCGCSNCTIIDNIIENCALNGISIKDSSTNNSIFNNYIKNVGFAGIHCNGNWIDSEIYNNKHHYIKCNEISCVGMFAVNGAGIYLLGSGHNYICNNLIHDTPRYGISIKGARYHCWPTDCGINKKGEISFAEHFKYLHSRNNLIEANKIFDAGKNSLDGGGIEAWGPGKGNVADYNLVYNYYNGKSTINWKGHGIFLDDATHYFTVTNNIVYESGKQGSDASIFMKSIGIIVRNNIFDVTNTHQGAANISPYDEPCQSQVFTNNIVYADPQGGIGEDGVFIENGSLNRRVYTYDLTGAINQSGDYLKYLDKNIYYNTKGIFTVSKDNNDPSKDVSWKDFVKETGFDKESIIKDPMFVNAKNRNYELLPESPALKLGFKNIDMSKIGLQK